MFYIKSETLSPLNSNTPLSLPSTSDRHLWILGLCEFDSSQDLIWVESYSVCPFVTNFFSPLTVVKGRAKSSPWFESAAPLVALPWAGVYRVQECPVSILHQKTFMITCPSLKWMFNWVLLLTVVLLGCQTKVMLVKERRVYWGKKWQKKNFKLEMIFASGKSQTWLESWLLPWVAGRKPPPCPCRQLPYCKNQVRFLVCLPG